MVKPHGKKTMCILTDIFITGGVESVIIDALPALSERYEVTLFVLSGIIDDCMRKRIIASVLIRTGSFCWTKKNELRIQLPYLSAKYFKRELKQHFDCLLIVKQTCKGAGLAHIADLNIYWNHETNYIEYTAPSSLGFMRRLNRYRLQHIFRHFDEIWHVNDEVKCAFEAAFSLTNCRILYNPLDTERVLSLAQEMPNDLDLVDDSVTIVMVGRLSNEKGFDRVIRAAKSIACSDHAFRLVIIGEGADRQVLENLASSDKLVNRVRFLGQKDNPYPYIKHANFVFLPSRTESFGLAALEAMLLQTPIIATKTLGFVQVTDGGKYGMLIDNTDESIRTALDYIVNNTVTPLYSLDSAMNWALSFGKDQFLQQLTQRLELTSCTRNFPQY